MELKRFCRSHLHKTGRLLIVPYGIETKAGNATQELDTLLIVPYGIETPLSAFLP